MFGLLRPLPYLAWICRGPFAAVSDLLPVSFRTPFPLAPVRSQLCDLFSTESWRTYFRDVFNILDLALIVGMVLTATTRALVLLGLIGGDGAALLRMDGDEALGLMLPCQAVTALFAWLRLLQVRPCPRMHIRVLGLWHDRADGSGLAWLGALGVAWTPCECDAPLLCGRCCSSFQSRARC